MRNTPSIELGKMKSNSKVWRRHRLVKFSFPIKGTFFDLFKGQIIFGNKIVIQIRKASTFNSNFPGIEFFKKFSSCWMVGLKLWQRTPKKPLDQFQGEVFVWDRDFSWSSWIKNIFLRLESLSIWPLMFYCCNKV